ncbi:YaaA family protein [Jiangella rhizosphaerae]|uniref:Peroxide stress protein YaaA n=1 Tax=Jiangella rhizosphaerae TaxID=2293569 RepID=A0A418KQ85_9ACTN|nr:peroxide stress protein YaaA [Jiangella rhizosphaerae]RIQ22305.1 peroxide stress protein YaaA [Jiangella rhizosphaerae]
MLIVLPPSETQARPARGRALDLARLSFPELTEARSAVLDGMVATSARPDAVRRLGAPAGAVAAVARNVDVRTAPTVAAGRLYQGVLYHAFDPATLDAASARRAGRRVVIVSSLFGAVRLGDRVPAYRLPICAHLDGLGGMPEVEVYWRPWLGPVLTEAAGRGVVVDLRSSSYASLWRPGPELAERWVVLRVPGSPHGAKATRGRVARLLCTEPAVPRNVRALAAVVGAAFDVELHPPDRDRAPWVLDVGPADPGLSHQRPR